MIPASYVSPSRLPCLKRKSNKPTTPTPPTRPPLPPARKWLFRFTALLLPFLALALVELGLRVISYGHDPAFFKVESTADGKQLLVHNDHFTRRFFPPELARWPETVRFAATKPTEVQRIFILGESAAMGDPQPSVGASRYLEVLLREKFPGQKFELINLGITAINSHVILPIAQDVAARGQGDLWLIYMGNNEMVGPFGAATVFGSRAPPLSAVRFNLALQKTRLGQLAVSGLRNLGGKPANATWGGMKMFLQNQIPPNDARRETVYQNFAHNLRDIVAAGQERGVKIVLSTMAVNLRDFPPFGSMLNSNLPATDQAQFESLFAEAKALQASNHPAAAAQRFEQAARIEPHFAELQFRWAQCLLAATNTSAARDHFQQACDADALPFRADTRINGAIRTLAKELAGDGFVLCDAEAALSQAAPAGIAGDESFFEHVHFNFDGNYRLARAWAEQVANLLPEELQRKAATGWAGQEACEKAIGLSDWNRGFVISAVMARMGQPPLAMQFNNPARLQALQQQLDALRERQRAPDRLTQAQKDFEAAIARAPTDALLHENFANFLEASGDNPRALAEYRKMTELLPGDFYGSLQAGRMLREAGRYAEAEPLLRSARASRPSLPEPYFELGVALVSAGKSAEALENFTRAVAMRPTEGKHLMYQAKALAQLNRHPEAIEIYREATRLHPNSWEAHFELAGELATAGQVAAALQEYQEVVRLNPRHAVSRINLGVVLVRQNRLSEAIQQFDAALALEPGNAAARDYLSQVTRRNQRR